MPIVSKLMSDSRYRLYLEYSSTQNVTANTSTITYNCYVRLVSGKGRWNYDNGKTGSVKSGSNTWASVTNQPWDLDSKTTEPVVSGTKVVNHNPDGTLSIPLIATCSLTNVLGTISGTVSTTYELPTIPRATTPTLSDESVDMGQPVTISTPRASDSFTHKLKYAFEGASGTIAEDVATSHVWTPPVSLASRIPNKASSACVITCETYNGSVLIGTKTVQLTLNVPASVAPTVAHVISEGVADVASKVGAYVQSKSRLKVVTTAQGVYGSTVNSIVTTCENANYNGNDITTGVIMGSGNVLVKTTATDSRGRSAVVQTTVPVLAYAPPKIDSASLQRCAPDGTLDPLGTHLKFALKASVSSLIVGTEKNRLRRKLSTKKSTDYTYTEKVNSLESGLTYDSYQVISGYEAEYVFDALMYVEDIFGVALAVGKIPTGKITMHWGDDFISVGAFRTFPGSGFEAHKPAYFPGGIFPIPIPEDEDLNDYTTPGFYFCAQNSIAATLANCPTDHSFSLEVLKHAGVRQVLKTYLPTASLTLERNFYDGTWGAWRGISFDDHTHAGTKTTGNFTTHETAHGTIRLGPMNTGLNHIYSTLNKPYYMDNDLQVASGKQVWHEGNSPSVLGASAGRQYLGGKSIIQAGKLSYPASTSEVNLVFPLAFPNACIAVVVTPNHGSTTPTWASISATVSALTKSGCKVQMRSTDNNQPSSVGRTVNYIAFGY